MIVIFRDFFGQEQRGLGGANAQLSDESQKLYERQGTNISCFLGEQWENPGWLGDQGQCKDPYPTIQYNGKF